ETVAQKVISNAAGGDVSAQQATMSAAQEIINDAEKDSAKAAPIVQQLEASKAIEEENTATGEQTQNPEKPNVTDISLEFPAFCGWAPTVCEAAQTVISFPRTLTNWWNTANQKADGWANSISLAWSDFWKEPNLEKEKDTEVNVDEKEVQDPSQFDQMYVQFGGQCPTFEVNTISVGSVSVPISFDLSPYCDFALKVRPAVIGFGYLVALGIVSNAIREV
ncbi:virulence factor TspB C-terminal domain-related protein, partial [Acinetobacter radioresistens]|uniref:virulence factor TspB C-terminal domain-related protein n=1 Tax=Acinetobacter radioresistens TaxID=40216 RepID=UPI00249F62C7